jgi:GNAT superfamily N-acetyltransferase
MTEADIPLGMRLSGQAGWNQLEADWQRMLDVQPDGGFVAELDGDAVGTVITCRFGPVAWVAMMLVEERFRGRGIGRALMVHALGDLDARGIPSVRLDATPQGRPLYESLGFEFEILLTRYEGILPSAVRLPGPTSVHYHDLFARVRGFDRVVTGTDRERLLDRLIAEHPRTLQVLADESGLTGFLMSRPGSRARQIGPCIAKEHIGPLLFEEARQRYAGEAVFIDIPVDNAPAIAAAGAIGLSPGRILTRMGRGPRVVEDLARLWASAGPEKG